MKINFLAILVIISTMLTADFTYAASYSRSYKMKVSFVKEHPCPATGLSKISHCTGYIIDHIIPLCAGGLDVASNMQWQTKIDAKIKDIAERAQCRKIRKEMRK